MLDKRQRSRVSFCAEYSFICEDCLVEGPVLDLSMDGALLRIDPSVPLTMGVEGELTIYLHLGGEQVRIPLRALVVRLSEELEDLSGKVLCGVRFASPSSDVSMELYRAMRYQCSRDPHNTLIREEA